MDIRSWGGDDIVSVDGAVVGGWLQVFPDGYEDEFQPFTTGQDRVVLNGLDVGRHTSIRTGGGNDSISVDDSDFGTTNLLSGVGVSAVGGPGSDRIRFDGVRIAGQVFISNYGDASTGERFVLDDEAANAYDVPFVGSPGIPDVTGHWQPDTDPLSLFDGDLITGTWRVWFADLGGGDLAHVESIALHFKTIPAPAAGAVFAAWVTWAAARAPRRRRSSSAR